LLVFPWQIGKIRILFRALSMIAMIRRMPFIIQASDSIGTIGWINPANEIGLRLIGSLRDAELFDDRQSAGLVASRLPRKGTAKTLVNYSVLSTDEMPIAA
jgi:hypothetical protein